MSTLTSAAAMPARLSAPVSPTQTREEAVQQARNIVDDIKSRSTLVGLFQPAVGLVGLAAHPLDTFEHVRGIAGGLLQGNLPAAGQNVSSLLDNFLHPSGVLGSVHKSGFAISAAVDGAVGAIEIYQAVRSGDKYLGIMGGADLLSCGANVAFAMVGGLPSLGLSVAAQATKVALVVSRPSEYSRIQKAKVAFDTVVTLSGSLMKAGVAPVVGFIAYATIGPMQIAYMNNARFRAKVDAAVDWVVDRFSK